MNYFQKEIKDNNNDIVYKNNPENNESNNANSAFKLIISKIVAILQKIAWILEIKKTIKKILYSNWF